MRFAFYKKGSAKKDVKNTDFHLSFDSLKINTEKFYLKEEEKLPENMDSFLKLSKKYFNTDELPFFILSEEELGKRISKSDFNLKIQEATGDYKTIYVNIPEEVDYVYSFYEESFKEQESQLENDFNRTNFPQFNYSKLVPLEINLGNQSVKLTYSTLKKVSKKRYFLFIVDLVEKLKTIFIEYNPRLYEIKKESEINIKTSIDNTPNIRTAALIIHGFMSKTEDNFNELKNVLRNSKKYDKVYGYSYAPNKVSIERNGKLLTQILDKNRLLNPELELDIFAHSEGGLVARSMIVNELATLNNHSIRNFNTAGTPHKGTIFAKIGYRALTLPRTALLIVAVIQIPNPQSILMLMNLLFYYLRFKENVGLVDMCPNSNFLKSLNNKPFIIKGSVLLTGYNVGNSDIWIKTIFTHIVNKTIFKADKLHDTVVTSQSSLYKFTSGKIFEYNDVGWHSDYFNKTDKAADIVARSI